MCCPGSYAAIEARTLIGRKGLVGAIYTFLGYRFLLVVETGDVPLVATLQIGDRWIESALGYHVERFDSKVGRKISHSVRFLWHPD